MAVKNFEEIAVRAKASGQKNRVVIAGADAENILLGAFHAQDDGFAELTLVGEAGKVLPMLDRLGLKDKPYRLVETYPGDNATQVAIEIINKGEGDILMRGNVQTREFLMPLLDKRNNLRTKRLLTHIDIVSMPEYPKLIAIGDVTVTVEPNRNQKKDIINNMVDTLRFVEDEKPNIALLALVEQTSFHMKDTIDAHELVHEHEKSPIADCNLVGPIAYDLILSKEAARLKNYDCQYCGDFDGIIAPSLLAGNLIVKGWQAHAHAQTCGVVVGAKIRVAITSRSDAPEVAYNSLAFCTLLPKDCPYL
ncbi:MAG: phosphate acyltransferase [Oscillospiraceae bacterium]|nr:phosphate acyltransferase [Oscillospiraceae bacterium]